MKIANSVFLVTGGASGLGGTGADVGARRTTIVRSNAPSGMPCRSVRISARRSPGVAITSCSIAFVLSPKMLKLSTMAQRRRVVTMSLTARVPKRRASSVIWRTRQLGRFAGGTCSPRLRSFASQIAAAANGDSAVGGETSDSTA